MIPLGRIPNHLEVPDEKVLSLALQREGQGQGLQPLKQFSIPQGRTLARSPPCDVALT